jgi:N-methylhydantoinase A
MTRAGSLVVGIDVGGTFTDVFAIDEATGQYRTAKVPSVKGDIAQGFVDGIARAVGDAAAVSAVVHGTTVGTNALLERRGARTGLIATKGFRDVLEMRRRDRPNTWRLWGEFRHVVSRDLSIEVDERTLADGTIWKPVDGGEVRRAATHLLQLGCEAVGIVFINAYVNGENERVALAAVREVWPNDHVNASSLILPEIREFERASTTALNVCLQPILGAYLGKLETSLAGAGCRGDLFIVQSNGGVMSVETARRLPVRTTLSGPAAGVIAGAAIAEAAGFPNVITCDMGGTSFDVALVAGGKSAQTLQTAIDFGLVIRSPMIEITTIGAGGGSIAWVDRGGFLQIGPESAGADPGPACYGQGADRPTVTDAHVALGRINPDRPIGGKLARLDAAAALAAIEDRVAAPLGLEPMAAAEAILRVANSRMSGAIRLVSIERGHDPKNFALMPFGGGGALHAGALMREVGLARAVVPRLPGITSAMGCVLADMRHDFVHTLNRPLVGLDLAPLAAEMAATAERGLALIDGAGVRLTARDVVFEIDMSYIGQTHTVAVPLPVTYADGRVVITAETIADAFADTYRRTYNRVLDGIPIRILSLRTSVIGRRPKFDLAALRPAARGSADDARTGERRVWIDGGWRACTTFERERLAVGARIFGPAIVEQPDTTVFVDPGLAGEVDPFGNLLLGRANGA